MTYIRHQKSNVWEEILYLVPANFKIVPPGINLSSTTLLLLQPRLPQFSSLEPCSSATLSESEFSHFYFLHHRRQELQSIIKLNFPQIRLKINREHLTLLHILPKNWLNMQLLFISNRNSLTIRYQMCPSLNFKNGIVYQCTYIIIYSILIARKSALEKTQLSDVLITDNLF